MGVRSYNTAENKNTRIYTRDILSKKNMINSPVIYENYFIIVLTFLWVF